MNIFKIINIVSFLLAFTIPTWAGDYTIRDKNYLTQGYIHDGKIYDKKYRIEGYIQNNKVYDKNYNLKGYVDKEYKGYGGHNSNRRK
jgi:hypothetical protein